MYPHFGEDLIFGSLDWEFREELVKLTVESSLLWYASSNAKRIEMGDSEALFRESKPLALLACDINGLALRYASPALRNDAEVVEVAVRKDWRSLRFASVPIRSSLQYLAIALSAINQNGWAYKYLRSELQEHQGLIRTAISHKPWVLRYVPEKHRNSTELAIAAAQKDGVPALKFFNSL